VTPTASASFPAGASGEDRRPSISAAQRPAERSASPQRRRSRAAA